MVKTVEKKPKIKIYYNAEMEDVLFQEPISYDNILYTPTELSDINETEGTKLTGIESGATANYGALADLDAVGADQILTNAVTELKIASQAVTNAKIAVNAIQGDVIAASAITETKVASDSISTPKLQTGSIVAGKIATGAVTSDKIYALSVTSDKIAAYAITSDKVTTGQLITLSAQIANTIITNAHINDLSANKINAGTLSADRIASGSIEDVKLGTTIISGGKIVTGLLTADNIQTGTLIGRTVQSSSGNDKIVLNNGDYLDFYSGGNLKARLRGTTAAAGGVKLTQGDLAIANNQSYLLEETTSNQFSRIGVNTSDQLVIVLPSTNQFFIKNSAETVNLFTVSNVQIYAGRPIGLYAVSSAPSGAQEGWMFFNTTYNEVWIFKGGAWKALAYVP